MNFNTFSHINTWIFDLDNTLYSPEVRLFDQIEEKMRIFVANFLSVSLEDADLLRAQYWHSHGTTLAGMMEMHAMPPDVFLSDVHDIDFSVLTHSRPLAELIAALPGRKIVYTNGTEPYARRVLAAVDWNKSLSLSMALSTPATGQSPVLKPFTRSSPARM